MQELFELSARMVTRKNRRFRRYLLSARPFESTLTILLRQRGVGKTAMLIQHLLDRFEEFIRFVEQAGEDRFVCLFAVPGTAVRGAQAPDDIDKPMHL